MSSEMNRNRDTAAYANRPAWHGIGVTLDGAPTSGLMIEAARLGWDVVPAPLHAETVPLVPLGVDAIEAALQSPTDGPIGGEPHTPELVKVGTHKALRRNDTGALLGVVGDGYEIVQNREVFDLLDSLESAVGGPVRYESAFTMQGGKGVCVVARLPGSDTIAPGDDVHRYCLAYFRHDGGGSVELAISMVRPVCMNTIQMALAEASANSERFRVRHTTNAKRNLERAVSVIRDGLSLYDGSVAKAREMAARPMTREDLFDFITRVYPVAEGASAAVKTRTSKVQKDAVKRYAQSPTNNLDSMRGTLWAAVNAVTEQVDHGPVARLRGDDKRDRAEQAFRRRMLGGSGAQLKADAWRVASEMIGAA